MTSAERLVCFKMCLKGTRKPVYENVLKAHEHDGLQESRPELVYQEIKDGLMRFTEAPMEKAVRVRAEWRTFERTKRMSALDFETKFITLTAQLESVGLPITVKEKLMSYLENFVTIRVR